jgi:hypothetical protein
MTYAIRQARGGRRTSRSSTIEGRGRPAALRRHLRLFSARRIAADLAKRGYATPSGQLYSASAIASMLGET